MVSEQESTILLGKERVMNEHLRPEEAAQALTEIRQRQQQVIDLAPLRDGLVDRRGVAAILGFVALTVGITLGLAFTLRASGVSHPATLAAVVGGLGMGIGGPILMRHLHRNMLANRAGSPQ
jgi:hypothetical protein